MDTENVLQTSKKFLSRIYLQNVWEKWWFLLFVNIVDDVFSGNLCYIYESCICEFYAAKLCGEYCIYSCKICKFNCSQSYSKSEVLKCIHFLIASLPKIQRNKTFQNGRKKIFCHYSLLKGSCTKSSGLDEIKLPNFRHTNQQKV